MCLLACSRLSDSGKAREYGEDAKVKDANRPSSPQFPSCFSCLRFLNSAGPTMSEPGTGLKSTVNAHCIRGNWVAFPKYSSSFDFEQ